MNPPKNGIVFFEDDKDKKMSMDQFKNIYIEQEARNSSVAKRAFQLFPENRIEVVSEKPRFSSMKHIHAQAFRDSKKRLFITRHKGRFFKRCPGVRPGLICCNYFVLNLGSHCDMDCTYCYLQSFINTPYVSIYSNIEDALDELSGLPKEMYSQKLRVGTGEITDSLSLDDLSLHSVKLVEFFSDFPHWTLEFKTKSNNIKNFYKLPHKGNIVVSWSIAPGHIVQKEEKGTASLKERIDAARLCRDHGFKIGFHLDPVIWHPEWKEHYQQLVEDITHRFSPSDLYHVSMGALRFPPEQRHLMRERWGMDSLVTRGEFFLSKDGKLRYDQRLRSEMFAFIQAAFLNKNPKWRIYLCMETKESWTSSGLSWKDQKNKEHFSPKPVRAFLHSKHQ